MKLSPSFSMVFIAVAIVACGGGGGDPTPTPAPVASSGSVSARFVKTANSFGLVIGHVQQANGVPTYIAGSTEADSVIQDSVGAITKIDDFALSGTPYAVQGISGDATYAQGRWNVGIVNASILTPPGSETQTATLNNVNNQSLHYILMNTLPSISTSGTKKTCGAGSTTKATYSETTAIAEHPPADATAQGSITFDKSGANVSLTVKVTTGDANSGLVDFSGIIVRPGEPYYKGGVRGNATQATVALGDGGKGSIFIGASYTVVLSNGANYQGVLILKCS
jgi:hypothetical protein